MSRLGQFAGALLLLLLTAASARAQEPWRCPTPPGVVSWDSLDAPAIPLTSNVVPGYPALFREVGIGGVVQFSFTVDTAGAVDGAPACIRQSGYDSFDRVFFTDWQFVAARARGRPVRSEYRFEVAFIPDDTLRGFPEETTLSESSDALVLQQDRARLHITPRRMTYGLTPMMPLPTDLDSLLLRQLYRAVIGLDTARKVDGFCVFESHEQWRRWDSERSEPGERMGTDCDDRDRHIAHIAPSFHDPRSGIYDGGVMRIIVGLRSEDTAYCRRLGNNGLCGRGYLQDFDCEVVRRGTERRLACTTKRSMMYYN